MGFHSTRDSSPSFRFQFLTYFFTSVFTFTAAFGDAATDRGQSSGMAGDGASHAGNEAAKHAGEAAKAEAEGDPMKAAMEMAMMMAQLAQMAAALAAAKKNKKGEKQAQANPPAEKPEVPEPSMKAEAKESPKIDLPQSSDTPTEVMEAAAPAPAPVPDMIAQQIAADHPEDMPSEAIAQSFDSAIPESIPEREKLGYDENGDGTRPNPGRSNFATDLSLASGMKDDRLFIPLDPANKGRKAKGEGSHEDASDGGGGSEAGEGVAVPRTDFASMISAALGKGEGALTTGLAGGEISFGPGGGSKSKGPHREIVDVGELNIFQYASTRYRQFSKDHDVKSKGLLTITHEERESLIAQLSSKNYLPR